jgi:hypothetical protein
MLAHDRTAEQIERYLRQPAHALGLRGEQGAGKGHTALYIASELLRTTLEALNEHPYVHILSAAESKVGIDEVRAIQSFLKLKVPGDNAIRRVVIIESIDMLGHEAQNALLKTLEEPPRDTVIIVTIAREQGVLPTIHSRIQHIQVLPVSQETAQEYFGSAYPADQITRSFFISDGLAGLLAALLASEAEHPLVAAIARARTIVGQSRFQRLAQVDKLLKDKDIQPVLLLDGMYRLINAGYKQSLKTRPNQDLKPIAARLALIERALTDIHENVQAKLVLSRLFLEF